MKKLPLIIGMLCMALAMQACGDTSLFPIDLNPNQPDNNNGNGNGSQLVGKSWKLESFEVMGGTVTPAPAGQSYVLTFLNSNQVSGTAFCNGYGGSYTLGQNGAISMSAFIATDAYCGDESKEGDYIGALEAAASYTLNGNTLRIFYANGTKVLNFVLTSGGIIDGTPSSIPELVGVTFKLKGFEVNDNMTNTRTMKNVPDDQVFLLTFNGGAPAHLTGLANCNSYMGDYTLGSASTLEIGNLGSSKINCGIPESMETEYFNALGNARQYSAWQDASGKAGLIIEYIGGALHFETE